MGFILEFLRMISCIIVPMVKIKLFRLIKKNSQIKVNTQHQLNQNKTEGLGNFQNIDQSLSSLVRACL